MTDTDPQTALIAEATEISNAATPGPWVLEQTPSHNWVGHERGDGKPDPIVHDSPREHVVDHVRARRDADAAFIARARTLIPELVAEVQRLQSLVSGATPETARVEAENEEQPNTASGLPQKLNELRGVHSFTELAEACDAVCHHGSEGTERLWGSSLMMTAGAVLRALENGK